MAFDQLAVEIDPARYVRWPGGGGFQPVTLRINGIELLERVRQIELPFAVAEYDRRRARTPDDDLGTRGSLAGNYLYLPPQLTFLPSRNLFGEPFEHDKSILLQCTCGIAECWLLLADIAVDDRVVRWSGFEQFHRDWAYDLGPFVFDRGAYEAQLGPRAP